MRAKTKPGPSQITFSSRSKLDEALDDFPKSEIWRIQTDGCQSHLGPDNFRLAFYQGMDAGFQFLRQHGHEQLSPELIEKIYQSAFQFEKDYKRYKGYSEGYNEFPLFFPCQGLEGSAGVSLAGIDELISSLENASANQGKREFPQLGVCIEISTKERPDNIPLRPNPLEDKENFKKDLIFYLMKATETKSACLVKKIKPDKLDEFYNVSLINYGHAPTREQILGLVQQDINNYYAELYQARQMEPRERKYAEITAVNHLVRKLHQSHYFSDGNGRTFVFLLANMLLLQNGHGMKITHTPSHYAAFSTEELLQETCADIAYFNLYKITGAKQYLSGLPDVNSKMIPDIKSQLLACLSQDPLIAMAQINEIFMQVMQNKIVLPLNYTSNHSPLSLFPKPHSQVAHQLITDLLKQCYKEQLTILVETSSAVDPSKHLGYGSNQEASKVLKSILARHHLFQLNRGALSDLVQNYGGPKTHEICVIA